MPISILLKQDQSLSGFSSPQRVFKVSPKGCINASTEENAYAGLSAKERE
jgi:hypothetical protein